MRLQRLLLKWGVVASCLIGQSALGYGKVQTQEQVDQEGWLQQKYRQCGHQHHHLPQSVCHSLKLAFGSHGDKQPTVFSSTLSITTKDHDKLVDEISDPYALELLLVSSQQHGHECVGVKQTSDNELVVVLYKHTGTTFLFDKEVRRFAYSIETAGGQSSMVVVCNTAVSESAD